MSVHCFRFGTHNLNKQKSIAIQKNGEISQDAIFKQVHEISPEESTNFTSSIFSTIMEDIYPKIKSDLGVERTKAEFSAVFKELEVISATKVEEFI